LKIWRELWTPAGFGSDHWLFGSDTAGFSGFLLTGGSCSFVGWDSFAATLPFYSFPLRHWFPAPLQVRQALQSEFLQKSFLKNFIAICF
jgi:hypothetical protein